MVVLATIAVIAHAATYVGSKNSNKYHYPSCRYARGINPENIVTFDSAKEARAAGYVPRKICRPPVED